MNVVLIVIDTLRADHLSCHGYQRPTSPNMDKLAAEGVRFENCFVQGSGTHPGFTTIMTGRSPVYHGVISHCGHVALKEGVKMLPEVLREQGYKTAAVDNLPSTWHFWLPEETRGVEPEWFRRGYDVFNDYGTLKQTSLETKQNAGQIADKAFELLDEIGDEQFFLFLHCWDPHTGYFPPPPFDRIYYVGDESDPKHTSMAKVREVMGDTVEKWHGGSTKHVTDANYMVAQYDGAITYCDYQLGRVFMKLEQMGVADDTLIVITGDHGENMLEHNPFFGHGGLYTCTTHVPLIMKYPRGLPEGKVFPQLVGHVDIVPTIFGVMGKEHPGPLEGIDLFKLVKGEQDKTREIVFSSGHGGTAAFDGRYRLKKNWDDRSEGVGRKILYDNLEDPDELVNVAKKHPEVVARLSKAIDEWIDALMEEAGREVYPYAEQEAKVKASEAALKKMRDSLGP
jgi:arylsulfatase A-like enzyme